MAPDEKLDNRSTPRLPLFLKSSYMQSPQKSGMLTPPLYSSAAVPFRWEEEPGKPRGFVTALSTQQDLSPKSLELPPRLLLDTKYVNKQLTSPTTVLDGPYIGKSSRFETSSFRCSRPEKGQLGALVLSKRENNGRGVLGSWKWARIKGFKGKREVGYVFRSLSMDRQVEDSSEAEGEEEISSNSVKITSIKRSGSCCARSTSHFWTSIYESLRQVVPWRSRKLEKEKATYLTFL